MFAPMYRGPTDNLQVKMSHEQIPDEIPFMQRLYNKIWLLAVLATIFFFVAYLGWAMIDIAAVPTG